MACKATYRVTAERRVGGWQAWVVGLNGPAGFLAGDLAAVERSARRLIWGYTGLDCDIDLDLRMPGAVSDRLFVIGQYHQDLAVEVRSARAEMAEMGLPVDDIERVLKESARPSAIDDGADVGVTSDCASDPAGASRTVAWG